MVRLIDSGDLVRRLTVKISNARPPMYDEIASVFDVRGKPVLFAWGDTIYCPVPCPIRPHLLMHEKAHGARQIETGIEEWWKRYLSDPEFRLEEEKIGHLAEYQWLADRCASRADRRRNLSHVASRLSSALYRYKITKDEARRFLENGRR